MCGGKPKWCSNHKDTARLLELGSNLGTAHAVKTNLKPLHLAEKKHPQLKVDAVVDVSQRTSVLSKLFQRRVRQVRR